MASGLRLHFVGLGHGEGHERHEPDAGDQGAQLVFEEFEEIERLFDQRRSGGAEEVFEKADEEQPQPGAPDSGVAVPRQAMAQMRLGLPIGPDAHDADS